MFCLLPAFSPYRLLQGIYEISHIVAKFPFSQGLQNFVTLVKIAGFCSFAHTSLLLQNLTQTVKINTEKINK